MRKIRPVLVTFYSISINAQIFFRSKQCLNKITTTYLDFIPNELLYYNKSYNIILHTLRHTKEIMHETN